MAKKSVAEINQMLSTSVIRDRRIDSIRGLMLLFIAINHFGGWAADIVWQPLGFVSDAEGFIFISGFIFAIVYGRYLVDYKNFAKKVIHRSFTVYKYHMYIVIGIPLICFFIPIYNAYWRSVIPYYYFHIIKYFISTAPLISQPRFMDVLPLYSIFIFMSWPFLILLHKGKYVSALIITFAIWILGQFFNPMVYLCNLFFKGADPGIFNVFSWQIVFMIGVYLGYKKRINEKIVILKSKIVKCVLLLIFIALFLLRYDMRFHVIPFDINLFPYLNRTVLPWLRLINFLSVVYIVSIIIKKIPVERGLIGAQFLGAHSLQVFTTHIFFAYLVLIPLDFGPGIIKKYGNFIYLLILAASIVILFLAAFLHKKYMDHHKKKMKEVKLR